MGGGLDPSTAVIPTMTPPPFFSRFIGVHAGYCRVCFIALALLFMREKTELTMCSLHAFASLALRLDGVTRFPPSSPKSKTASFAPKPDYSSSREQRCCLFVSSLSENYSHHPFPVDVDVALPLPRRDRPIGGPTTKRSNRPRKRNAHKTKTNRYRNVACRGEEKGVAGEGGAGLL